MKTVFFGVLTIISIWISHALDEKAPMEFLLSYGYLEEKNEYSLSEKPSPEEMQKAVVQFQKFNGLPVTGMLDNRTTQKMAEPRCGVKDVEKKGPGEYNIISKWPKNLITWRITKFSRTSRMPPAYQKRAIERGLRRWGHVTPLQFRETSGKPTLDISFVKQYHGDGNPFDGRGRVLAHAYFPQNGNTHFDDDEIWINGKRGGTNLETVAAHEFGHALGLRHSQHPQALMSPYYQVFPDHFKLHSDDIAGIQRLYGEKGTIPKTIYPVATRRIYYFSSIKGNGFCNHLYNNISAAMRISGNDFVFVDDSDVIEGRNGSKMNIRSLFPEGPRSVQAAVYSRQARKAYLFKDKRVWAYSLDHNGGFVLADKYPKELSNSYAYSPESAMQYNYGFEIIYVIKNGYYYEFFPNEGYRSKVRGYATRRFFTNIPQRIDATLSADNEIYFITGNKAYKMKNSKRSVDIRGKPVNLIFKKCPN